MAGGAKDRTELPEVEARPGGRREAGARGERGVAGRVLEPARRVGPQPITRGVLMTTQLRRRGIPTGKGRGVKRDGAAAAGGGFSLGFCVVPWDSDCLHSDTSDNLGNWLMSNIPLHHRD